jgi:ferredoxin
LDDDGYCETREVVVPAAREVDVRDGADSCPERAIFIEVIERGTK